LPEEYEKCLVGLTAILREAWNTSQQTEDTSFVTTKECYSMKLDLLTNTTVVDDAIRFVASGKSKDKDKEEQVKSSSSSSDSSGKEEDNKDKASEEKHEEETDEITINQVF
jgi:hypothetical protein